MLHTNISFSISEFLRLSLDEFNGIITSSFQSQHSSLSSTQTAAWKREYEDLQLALQGLEGRVIFEYSIPSLPKVVDIVLLTAGKVFIIEYKANSTSYYDQDIRQVEGYALRLKFFHSQSNDNWIIPILVATDAPEVAFCAVKSEEDMVFKAIKCNSNSLRSAIDKVNELLPFLSSREWEEKWETGIFKASPTIIDAARTVWKSNNVKGFTKGESSIETRLVAEDFIVNTVVRETQNRRGKSICFVTGVPGAGKTLVGLNISVRLQSVGASLLSGNGPLVEVLSTALKRDLSRNKKRLVRPKDEISVDSIIRGAYGYKKEIFAKRLEYTPGVGTVRLISDAEMSEQHVIIFDEAQRAWNKQKLISPGQTGRKYWQEEAFPFSEPGLLLWDMNQRDWGVFVCLVGGGQEINTGESGICEWLRSIKDNPDLSDWMIYMSDQMSGSEYDSKGGDGDTLESYKEFFSSKGKLRLEPSLHLTVCQRSNRTERVSEFVQALLDCNQEKAKDLYDSFRTKYQIYLTRDIDKAKEKLRERRAALSPRAYRDGVDDEEIRIGMLMSSQAARLRPLGFSVIKVSEFLTKIPNWFLDSDEYVNSSNFLELAMNEFFVQGLELDLDAVLWDADFRYNPQKNAWDYFVFNGKEWSAVDRDDSTHIIKRFYMMNAYRVLLTRARAGMVIVVPNGSELDSSGQLVDSTRNPLFYDCTYEYLCGLGLTRL